MQPKIFISSTYSDLVEQRKVVSEVISKLGGIPIQFETFSETAKSSWSDMMMNEIEKSDCIILIVGDRYGALDKNSHKSFTQLEFEYAKHKNIPIIGLIKKSNDLTSPIITTNFDAVIDKAVEEELKLKEFKNEVITNRVVSFFESNDDLKIQTTLALQEVLRKELGIANTDTENINLLFDKQEITNEEIAEIILLFSKLYQSIGGDELEIKRSEILQLEGSSQFELI